jgi:hypothetical protein
MGNYHAQFLGGLGPAMAPGYPVFSNIWFFGKISQAISIEIAINPAI